MLVEIKTRNMKIDDKLHDYMDSKTEKLEKYLSEIQTAKVEIEYEKNARIHDDRFKTQITVLGKGFVLRAEERTGDPFASFDKANERIQSQIRKFKGKHYRGKSNRGIKDQLVEQNAQLPEIDSGPTIVRRKKFFLQPMDEYEAIEKSNLSDHPDFYVFFNKKTDSVNVLYKRHNDSYGLIDTELT
jgi:putative sigma-54 modulation protein